MFISLTRGRLSALCIAIALTACGSDHNHHDQKPPTVETPPLQTPLPPELADAVTLPGTPEGEAVSARIGPEGGALASADGRMTVEVPAGAFDTEQTVQIQPITNTAHGGPGMAYRISPEGLQTPIPMTIRWHWSDEDLAGSVPGLLAAGYRDDNGLWRLLPATLDRDAKTLSVSTHHFSDWSMLPGAILTPAISTVRTGESAELRVVICQAANDELDESDIPMPGEPNSVRLPCKYDAATLADSTIENWAVNGRPGGDATVGWITGLDKGIARYTAPDAAPEGLLAVSVDVTGAEPIERQMLATSVKVVPTVIPIPPTNCDSYYAPYTKGWSVEMTIDYAYSDSAPFDDGTAYLTVEHSANLHATLSPQDVYFHGAFDAGESNFNSTESFVFPDPRSNFGDEVHESGVPEPIGNWFNIIPSPDCSYIVAASVNGHVVRSARYEFPVDVPYATLRASVELDGRVTGWGEQNDGAAFFIGDLNSEPRAATPYVQPADVVGTAKVTWVLTPIAESEGGVTP